MNILFLNSALPPLYVAVVVDEKAVAIKRASSESCFSIEGISLISEALQEAKLSLTEIDLFAFVVGPGSFTGIRTGLSLLKGLSFGRNVSGYALSSLDILAMGFRGQGQRVCPIIDARLGQVYASLFNGEGNREWEDRAIAPDILAAELSGKVLLLGRDAELFSEEFAKHPNFQPVCQSVDDEQMVSQGLAELNHTVTTQKAIPMELVEPLYLRKSYAEINLENRS